MFLLIDTREPEPLPERLRPDWALGAKLALTLSVAISLAVVPSLVAIPLCVLGLLLTLNVGRHVHNAARQRPRT